MQICSPYQVWNCLCKNSFTSLFTLTSSGCNLSVQLGGITTKLIWLDSRISYIALVSLDQQKLSTKAAESFSSLHFLSISPTLHIQFLSQKKRSSSLLVIELRNSQITPTVLLSFLPFQFINVRLFSMFRHCFLSKFPQLSSVVTYGWGYAMFSCSPPYLSSLFSS